MKEKKLGFIFPGQGSQYVGMGKDLYQAYPEARKIYDDAEEVLRFDIKQYSFQGPAEELQKTSVTQLAVLVHSLACLEILRGRGVRPSLVAGHSLGEYAALYAAGAVEFKDVLRLVKYRSEVTHDESMKRKGIMAAIIGPDAETVENICRRRDGKVVLANYNAPDQTVISGEVDAVENAIEDVKGLKTARVIPLRISGAFHSPLLMEAAERFREMIRSIKIEIPKSDLIVNVSGELARDVQEIRQALEQHLTKAVQWVKTVQNAKALGTKEFLELGPGRVLCGLLKKIDRHLVCTHLGKVKDFVDFFSSP